MRAILVLSKTRAQDQHKRLFLCQPSASTWSHSCMICPAIQPSVHFAWFSCLKTLASLLSDTYGTFKSKKETKTYTYYLYKHIHFILRTSAPKLIFVLHCRVCLFSLALQRDLDQPIILPQLIYCTGLLTACELWKSPGLLQETALLRQ